jgi:hypothetical protein
MKAMKKIKESKFDLDQIEENAKPLNEWYVNHFTLDRKGYFIITDANSLFSIIKPSVGVSNRKLFEDLIRSVFSQFETEYNITDDKISVERMRINKTNNKSILGSQNELIRMAEAIFYYDDQNYEDLSKINETPMMYTKSFPNIDIKYEVKKRKDF